MILTGSVLVDTKQKVFFNIRKVYVLGADKDWQSYWMIFDIGTQFWTIFPNDLNSIVNCCPGRVLTIRNFHYYFHNEPDGSSGLSPYYRILDNGTTIDLKISEIPFSKELEAAREKSEANGNVDGYGFLSIELAPFYQRFYADVPN